MSSYEDTTFLLFFSPLNSTLDYLQKYVLILWLLNTNKCLFLVLQNVLAGSLLFVCFILPPYPWMLWPANTMSSAPSGAFIEPKVAVMVSASHRSCTVLAFSNASFLALLNLSLKLFARGPFLPYFLYSLTVKGIREFPMQLCCIFGPNIHSRAWALMLAGCWKMHSHAPGAGLHLLAQIPHRDPAFALGSRWENWGMGSQKPPLKIQI